MLDLRTERNLDALDVDDQIGAGRHDACGKPASVSQTFPGGVARLVAIVYRSSTTPQQSVNYAFFAHHHFGMWMPPLAQHADRPANHLVREVFTTILAASFMTGTARRNAMLNSI